MSAARRSGLASQTEAVGSEEPTTNVSRLSVNLSKEVADALRWIKDRREITTTEAVRRSISTQRYIEEALERGAKILIVEEEGPARELVFLQ